MVNLPKGIAALSSILMVAMVTQAAFRYKWRGDEGIKV
jgi:hypothetical protein